MAFDILGTDHLRSGVPVVLGAADKLAATKQAVDEIRSYCAGVAMADGGAFAKMVIRDIQQILADNGLLQP